MMAKKSGSEESFIHLSRLLASAGHTHWILRPSHGSLEERSVWRRELAEESECASKAANELG